ncbi:metallophosphoesterase [Thermococcus profundus]|uniref:Metallophosphoesterase n=1 Tax=Thermococcus profundus TaxID=49899 RepID=A0A2Z2MBJ3_THEPR|nr:metallophosphoesterase [Thermococcus profundus]ASJ03186.1 metallophosphoesterase [Thermococcus profundus]
MVLNILKKLQFRRDVPAEISSSGEVTVMHVSDTPESVYPFVQRLIEKISPDYIIHTGDLADNLKLERRPELLPRYRGAIRKLASILKGSGAELYIVPGNEDDVEVIREFFGDAVVDPGTVVEIEGVRFALGHRPEEVLGSPVDFRLYGHNFKLIEKGLNGVLGVNFVLLPSGRTYRIKYPPGTDTCRGYKMWRGL